MLKRLAIILLLAGAALMLLPHLGRDLWFDEALTVLQFAVLPDAAAICRNYVIPNNQIVHTILLHHWMQLVPPENTLLRIFPMLTALAAAGGLWAGFRRRLGAWPLGIALTAWILSVPFAIYGTALRGYMLSAFWIALALRAACHAAENRRYRDLAWWAVWCFLAVGTIPTNLLGLCAAVLYAAPFFGKKFWKTGYFWFFAWIPLVMLGIFYLPILPRFLGCCRLGEGWHDHGRAAVAVLLPVGVTFAVPMLLSLAVCRRWFRRREALLRGLIWLQASAVVLIFSVAPFPRTFFPLFPVYVILLAGGLRHGMAVLPPKRRKMAAWTAFLLTLVWGWAASSPCFLNVCSRLSGGPEQDDYFLPYCMEKSFSPSRIAGEVLKLDPDRTGKVFASFRADPWSMLFALLQRGAPAEYCVFDGPRRKVDTLPDRAMILLHREEDPAPFAARFGGRLVLPTEYGRSVLYQLQRPPM